MKVKVFLRAGLVLVVALFLTWQISRSSIFLWQTLNLTSLVVIYYAQKEGEIFGASLGALAGLLLDSISAGIIGSFGIPKTIIGFAAGYTARRVDVLPFFSSLFSYFTLLVSELIIWSLLQVFILKNPLPGNLILYQPFVSALLGVSLIWITRNWGPRVVTLIRRKKKAGRI